jgi:hypothetical protein
MFIVTPRWSFVNRFPCNFLAYNFYFDSTFDFQPGPSSHSLSIDTMANVATKAQFPLYLDNAGFLVNDDGHQLVWIPAHLRGNAIAVDTSSRTVAIGGGNGPITIIRFLHDP